jgi:hypothetical protein
MKIHKTISKTPALTKLKLKVISIYTKYLTKQTGIFRHLLSSPITDECKQF